jgi:hypothetical protein
MSLWTQARLGREHVQAFKVCMPSGDCYWTVLDQQMQVMPAADGFLR